MMSPAPLYGSNRSRSGFRLTALYAIAATFLFPTARLSAQAPALTPEARALSNQIAIMNLNGGIDRAAVLIEAFQHSAQGSDYDRWTLDGMLADYYQRLGQLPQAIGAIDRILSSEWLTNAYHTPLDRARVQARWRLALGKDELQLAHFDAAAAAASQTLAIIESGGLSTEERKQAERVRDLAFQHEAHWTEPLPTPRQPALAPGSQAAAPLEAGDAARFDTACAAIEEHLNAGDLVDLKSPALDDRTAIDLFGDGTHVMVEEVNGSYDADLDLKVTDPTGRDVPITRDPGVRWDELSQPRNVLLEAAGRFVFLMSQESAPSYVMGMSKDHVERKVCEFKPVEPLKTEKPQYARLSPFERLAKLVDAQDKPGALFDYALSRPDLDAVKVILDESRATHDPTLLVSSRSTFPSDSILIAAIRSQRLDALKILLEDGVDPDLASEADPNHPQVQPETPLSTALKYEDLEAMSLLLAHGADPNRVGGMYSLLRNVYEGHHATQALRLLLDSGADPDTVPVDLGDLVQRKASARDWPDKIDLLLRHGANAGWWTHALFNSIAGRSDLAVASQLSARDGDQLPQSVTYVPIKTVWVDNLLRNPTRSPDNGLEPLLREAQTVRDAADCPADARGPEFEWCLPATVRRSLSDLQTAEAQTGWDTAARRSWDEERDARCQLKTRAAIASAGWVSHVLAEPERARCVVAMNREQIMQRGSKP